MRGPVMGERLFRGDGPGGHRGYVWNPAPIADACLVLGRGESLWDSRVDANWGSSRECANTRLAGARVGAGFRCR